jgi:hypothetical protein
MSWLCNMLGVRSCILYNLRAGCPFSVGDVVRAKMSGYPAWPGILTLCPVSNLWSKVSTETTRFIWIRSNV